MAIQNPVIVVPGITASELRDEYLLKPDIVWSAVINKQYERIMLHPDDVRYERTEPARVRPNAIFSMPYEELVLELRHNLTTTADDPVPVYPFAYDWRQPLERTEAELAAFIHEVADRTRLLRHYARAGYAEDPRVDLVGHSMGGLIIAGCLQGRGGQAPVGKVATLGTPYRGSYEAPIKVLTGTASLGTAEPSSREREAARLTPALYHLLPRFENAVVDTNGKEVDIFEADAWQQGVFETLAEFIRLNGVDPPRSKSGRLDMARTLLQGILQQALEHRERVESFQLSDLGLEQDDWLCIVGLGANTRVRLRLSTGRGSPRYELSGKDRLNQWDDHNKSVDTGDGTVPYLGAKPTFLGVENLVCVCPDDLGYWEWGDRAMLPMVGFHGMLPKVNLIHRLIVAHLRGEKATGNDSLWGRAAPDIGDRKWNPPLAGLKRWN
jgi:pimeloyl-ACP methyl ester carboxylesterase